MKKSIKKYKIQYLNTNNRGTKEEYISIDTIEFDNAKEAYAFWHALDEDNRVTEKDQIKQQNDEDFIIFDNDIMRGLNESY